MKTQPRYIRIIAVISAIIVSLSMAVVWKTTFPPIWSMTVSIATGWLAGIAIFAMWHKEY